MPPIVIALVAFVAMEPLTAATHRWVMHGVGIALHRSHHRRLAARFEANDAFPVVFAALVCGLFALGLNLDGWSPVVPVAVGITLYGAAYAVVHDVYIHGRLRWFGDWRPALLERLAAAHRLHHRFNAAPYGMLLPVVPRHVRERVASAPGT
ncbi:MAG: sterol desaturase family protein [Ilumatobacter sp.]|uniref:sterol desaturase family protein n=1 Tax=Ilumatobacter sp. TaxID=1967498 RepID=UPI002616ED3D|nr:sterol desaturase family protein [Ilumatobacter sp.]MDJ0769657.1 sterol desaturase family protein [Ilumatobacter sp.]